MPTELIVIGVIAVVSILILFGGGTALLRAIKRNRGAPKV